MGRVLVADDEEGLRAFMVEALEDEDHDVDAAPDGQQALERLRAGRYEVLVTDLKMPGLDGLELLEAIRPEQPELEVIVLTAHGTVTDAVTAMRLGAFDFLEKPLPSPNVLRHAVARALERHRQRAPSTSPESDDGPRLGYGSAVMAQVEAMLTRAAPTEATILLTGESGTGKEVAARLVHARSRRRDGPFVAVNCAALSSQLLESELFGHEKGAFTGADQRRQGRIEMAEGGTFFLDEIGELELGLQAKLLRVLQERAFERVGGHQTVQADVRWLAATNRDLLEEVDRGRFREDLYHRLGVIPVRMPSLAERAEDIGPLAESLVRALGAQLGRPDLRLGEPAKAALRSRTYRGNVRELGNLLERAAILSTGDLIGPADLDALAGPPSAPAPADAPATLEAMERQAIADALAQTDGSRKQAAAQLGISVRTLYDRIKKHGLG